MKPAPCECCGVLAGLREGVCRECFGLLPHDRILKAANLLLDRCGRSDYLLGQPIDETAYRVPPARKPGGPAGAVAP